MTKSDSIAHLAEALSKAQGSMRNAVKDSENPFFKSKYADLATVIDAGREPLSANGLAVVQLPTMREGKMVLEYMLIHSSGEFIASEMEMTPVKTDPQGLGSVVSYARRYTLSALVGIAQTDDDANAATHMTGSADAQKAAMGRKLAEIDEYERTNKPPAKKKSAPRNTAQETLQEGVSEGAETPYLKAEKERLAIEYLRDIEQATTEAELKAAGEAFSKQGFAEEAREIAAATYVAKLSQITGRPIQKEIL